MHYTAIVANVYAGYLIKPYELVVVALKQCNNSRICYCWIGRCFEVIIFPCLKYNCSYIYIKWIYKKMT